MFGIFAALAEFEREPIRERTVAGLKAARAWPEGRPQVRSVEGLGADGAGGDGESGHVGGGALRGAGVGRGTLYRYVDPGGVLRENGRRVLDG